MKKRIFAMAVTISVSLVHPVLASEADRKESTAVNGLDFGPLTRLIGTWKTAKDYEGTDVAPGQAGSTAGRGGVAVEPYYEVLTFEPVADAKNASDQHNVSMYYKHEVFRSKDNGKFHDQRGYFSYDKKNNMVYNTFCIPRAVCVVAEGSAGPVMLLESKGRGIAESEYMTKNDTTTKFSLSIDFSGDKLEYTQITSLHVYGQPFEHADSSTLEKIE